MGEDIDFFEGVVGGEGGASGGGEAIAVHEGLGAVMAGADGNAVGAVMVWGALGGISTAGADDCAEFDRLVASTYNFDISKLTAKEIPGIEKRLNAFWTTVSTRKKEFLPCLEKAVADPTSKGYLRFDGANLLLRLAPTEPHKRLLIEVYTGTNIKQASPDRWVMTLSWLASEGYDIGPAAERWMKEGAKYDSNGGEHQVSVFRATLTLFASMHEAKATPLLERIAKDAKHPGQGAAIAILADQWTDESRKVLRELDPQSVPAAVRDGITRAIDSKPRIEARAQPKVSREEFLKSFEAFVKGDGKPFTLR